MGIFKRLFSKNWEPLRCRPGAIIELFEECLRIDAPISEFVIEYDGRTHEVGMTAAYERRRGFFDIDFYVDGQHFPTLDEFCENGKIDGVLFQDLDEIRVLEDKAMGGDPRNNILLEDREIK